MYTHECANTYLTPMFVNYMGLREKEFCTENWAGCLSEQAHLDKAVPTCTHNLYFEQKYENCHL